MAETRILVKLAGPVAALPATMQLGASAVKLQRLFQAPAVGGQGVAAAAAPAWYSVEAPTVAAFGARGGHRWDAAHAMLQHGLGVAGATVVAAEPDIEQPWILVNGAQHALGASAAPCTPEDQKGVPFDEGPGFGWHLDDQHSQLRAARDAVGDAARAIKIVHLDTGYDPAHKALPANLAPEDQQRNFVEGGNSAVDRTPTSSLDNRGHGTGTIGILAGGTADGLDWAGGKVANGFGPLGGAPLCQVVPVRIANSVAHFWTSTVAQGIDYAREIGADVLSMSMGGLPSSAWADAVNRAYEAGVVLVCAAGNSIDGLPTSLIVYPARFNRVIAACGVMAAGHPYYGLGGPMEGCVGPPSKMATAMAAYTPNTTWLRLGCPNVVDMSGTGTSSATPQVAAAAALWLAQHGGNYGRSWQRVEAVRAALFGDTSGQPNRYFGRGILRTNEALGRTAPGNLTETPPDSASFAFLHLLSSVFGIAQAEPRALVMLHLELTQLALVSRGAREAVPDPGLPPDRISDQQRRRFLEAILDEGHSSMALRQFIGAQLGRGTSVPTTGVPHAGQAEAAPPATQTTSTAGTGAGIRRTPTVPMPSRRRIRVFATDPGDSSRLATAFINVTTVEVPWERLRPGPVGEYLEVVDVDPATDAAYDPVDLDDPYLLAEQGLPPSEGNPQFHQQMVYAIAMRTIRNFEIALGRRAIWAPRRRHDAQGNFVPAPDGGYVQRLRIYPHALREENAYYSPDKKALLFGYFADAEDTNRRRTVFACLSHDIVAHETTHALLDGLHPRFQEATNPDVLAFHEAFADVVAIFQHFTFPELLRFEIGRLRGDLREASLLSDLARQFGQALHNGRALRQAIDAAHPMTDSDEEKPEQLKKYADAKEAHERGAVLVTAIFEAFVAIYRRRTEDLVRIATGGSGLLGAGAIHPDLVARLAENAVDVAQRMLTLCIRALDYMPPVDPTFGDYLRALVTVDADLAPDHGYGYRVALAEAFNKFGIYPDDISSVSPDGLLWQPPAPEAQPPGLNVYLQGLDLGAYTQSDRRRAFHSAKQNAAKLHDWLSTNLDVGTARLIGLDLHPASNGARPKFEVHSVRPAQRVTADGENRTDIVAVITQSLHDSDPALGIPPFRGGCTLILNREYDSEPIRFAIARPIWNTRRKERMDGFLGRIGRGVDAIYGIDQSARYREPFAMLHAGLKGE